jgi:hypothetical protein
MSETNDVSLRVRHSSEKVAHWAQKPSLLLYRALRKGRVERG